MNILHIAFLRLIGCRVENAYVKSTRPDDVRPIAFPDKFAQLNARVIAQANKEQCEESDPELPEPPPAAA